MSIRITLPAFIAAILCSALLSDAPAQEPAAPPQQLDPAAIEKLWTAYATPGPAHERFQEMVGRWKTDVSMFMQDPENPQKSEGKAEFELLLGGRYVRQTYVGEMEGKPFHGMSITGYDNAANKYVGIWIDDMSTGMLHTTGVLDEESGTIIEKGAMASPLGEMAYRMVTMPVDKDEFHFTMYMTMAGAPEQKTMEITYTRIKE